MPVSQFAFAAVLTCAITAFAESDAAKPTPYGGTSHPIPGVIEAEHYDEGPAGVAYHDVDEKNEGVPYRKDTYVDIEGRDDASNGHGIGWTRTGEWLIYTVDVKKSGTYSIEFPVASNKEGGTFRIEMNGVDVTGSIKIPDTGGWQVLKSIRKDGVVLEEGIHAMKVVMEANGPSGSIGDIDLMRFQLAE